MSEYHVVREYPKPLPTVWKALTDAALVPLWTSTGQGGRPEGFKPEVGTKFRFIGKPFPGWDGIVRCEVLAVDEPRLLRYDWRNKESADPTIVTNRLEEIPGITCTKPEGAFYVYPNVSAYLGKPGAQTAMELAGRLLNEAHVVSVPGEAFGTNQHIRLSYAVSHDDVEEGVKRMKDFFAKLSA